MSSTDYIMGRSGYMSCACRDCFEIAIGDYNPDGSPVPTLCGVCAREGCEIHVPGTRGAECRNPGAYGGEDGAEY